MKTGQAHGKTYKRHASSEFIDFLSEVVRQVRWAKEIHIVLDNLSAHKTEAVEAFLALTRVWIASARAFASSLCTSQGPTSVHARVSSWLNQVELWFAKIQRDLLARGIFTSVADL